MSRTNRTRAGLKNVILFGVFLVWAGSVPVEASSLYVHKIESYPSEGTDCQSLAKQVGQEFVRSAGVKFYAASGSPVDDFSCHLEVGYVSEDAVVVRSSVDDRSFSSEPYQSAYFTQAQCERALEYESERFEQATGLKPWLAYCFSEGSLVRKLKYVAYVEGLGASKALLFKNSRRINIAPQRGWEEFARSIYQSLSESSDYIPVTVRLNSAMTVSMRELSLRYYTNERHWIQDIEVSIDSDGVLCEQQVAEVSEFMKATQQRHLISYCGSYNKSDHRLVSLYLVDNILAAVGPKLTADVRTFSMSAECLTAKSEVVEFYRTELSRPVLGGVCGRSADGQSYRVYLFEDRNPQ